MLPFPVQQQTFPYRKRDLHGHKRQGVEQGARPKGTIKENLGSATGNEDLRTKGKTDRTKASLKDAGEKVKDAVSNIKDAVADK